MVRSDQWEGSSRRSWSAFEQKSMALASSWLQGWFLPNAASLADSPCPSSLVVRTSAENEYFRAVHVPVRCGRVQWRAPRVVWRVWVRPLSEEESDALRVGLRGTPVQGCVPCEAEVGPLPPVLEQFGVSRKHLREVTRPALLSRRHPLAALGFLDPNEGRRSLRRLQLLPPLPRLHLVVHQLHGLQFVAHGLPQQGFVDRLRGLRGLLLDRRGRGGAGSAILPGNLGRRGLFLHHGLPGVDFRAPRLVTVALNGLLSVHMLPLPFHLSGAAAVFVFDGGVGPVSHENFHACCLPVRCRRV